MALRAKQTVAVKGPYHGKHWGFLRKCPKTTEAELPTHVPIPESYTVFPQSIRTVFYCF